LIAGCSEQDAVSGPASATTSEASSGSLSAGGSTSTGTSGAGTTGEALAPTGTAGTTGMTGMTGMIGTTGMEGESTAQGQDTGDTEDTGTSVSTGDTGAPAGLGFAADIWPIFDATCACHKDSGGAGKLRLGSDDAYANLINMPSNQAPMMLVAPGSSVDSYLWYKLNDTQLEVGGSGKRMPSGGLLEPAAIELIQEWIDAGANP
jgi:hypothetical protein